MYDHPWENWAAGRRMDRQTRQMQTSECFQNYLFTDSVKLNTIFIFYFVFFLVSKIHFHQFHFNLCVSKSFSMRLEIVFLLICFFSRFDIYHFLWRDSRINILNNQTEVDNNHKHKNERITFASIRLINFEMVCHVVYMIAKKRPKQYTTLKMCSLVVSSISWFVPLEVRDASDLCSVEGIFFLLLFCHCHSQYKSTFIKHSHSSLTS